MKLVVQYVAYLRPSELYNLTAGQVFRPLHRSGASSWALFLAPQEELKASKTAEFDESVLLDGHLSVALIKIIDEIHSRQDGSGTPLERISGKVCRGFCQMGRDLWSERDHDSSFLGSSRRSVVRCALANPIIDGNSKTRQMAQREKRQEVRKARSVAQGNLEAVRRHAKVWTTVTKRCSDSARGDKFMKGIMVAAGATLDGGVWEPHFVFSTVKLASLEYYGLLAHTSDAHVTPKGASHSESGNTSDQTHPCVSPSVVTPHTPHTTHTTHNTLKQSTTHTNKAQHTQQSTASPHHMKGSFLMVSSAS